MKRKFSVAIFLARAIYIYNVASLDLQNDYSGNESKLSATYVYIRTSLKRLILPRQFLHLQTDTRRCPRKVAGISLLN